MVSTRTQTGSISTRTYTPLSISLDELSLRSPTTPTRPSCRRNGPGSPTKVIKPTSPRKASRKGLLNSPAIPKQKLRGSAARLTTAELSHLDIALQHGLGRARETPIPIPNTGRAAAPRTLTRAMRTEKTTPSSLPTSQKMTNNGFLGVDMCPGNAIFPSAIFGAREEAGLSKIGRADKEVQLWEEILVTHQQNIPDLVPIVEEKLQEAKERRACLDEKLQENLRVGDVNPAASAIKTRLETLQWGLDTSKFVPEAENIKCAMAGYNSGKIGYTDHYTIIYAGHIVDTAFTYLEFVRDRKERLDRYFEIHGEGWLWYEPPLNVHPESKPKMLASAALERQDEWSSMGPYHVNQGFWKRAGFVRRMAQTQVNMLAYDENIFTRDPNDPSKVDCQSDGPRLAFRSLLDSGATFPSLHTEDLNSLGIDFLAYGAQCISTIDTAAGRASSRVFELFVCVLDDEGKQLVDPNSAVWPLSHHYLGGLCPVLQSINPMQYDASGREIPNRLSGMIPFVACYVASAPTRNFLFLGEDRNDVLGSHRMPGQKKWAIELPVIPAGLPFDRYGNPKILFDHRNGMIVDKDREDIPHVSTITFLAGQANEFVVESNPGSRQIDRALGLNTAPERYIDPGVISGGGGA